MKSKDYFYISLLSILFSFNLINKNPIQSILDTPFSLEDKALQISVRALTSEESRSILKYDLTANGYKPIEVTISNQGSHTYELSRASTSLPCATAKEIAWKKTKGTIPRGLGLKILGFIFWPFAIASGIEGIATYKKHKQMVNILKAKGFKDDAEEILPYSLVKRVLYVPKDKFEKTFSVALEDLTGDDLIVIPVEISK
ncbi:MAG: hypothetical protein ACRDFB_04055 [Rhabdochlamydiaceae bacterium]